MRETIYEESKENEEYSSDANDRSSVRGCRSSGPGKLAIFYSEGSAYL